MVNNVSLIRNLMKFDNPGDFYFLQILRRRKDNPGLERDMYVLSDHYFHSFEEFDAAIPGIIKECDENNARAYFRFNVRNKKKINLQLIKRITDLVIDGNKQGLRRLIEKASENHDSASDDFDFRIIEEAIASIRKNDVAAFPKTYASIAGEFHTDVDKKWILDVDWKDFPEELLEASIQKLEFIATELQAQTGREPLLYRIPTKNGIHYIVRPFNLQKFRDYFPQMDVHRDNPTCLYIP